MISQEQTIIPIAKAWSIRELANNSDDYNRMRQVWEQLIYAMVKTGVAAANETNTASQSRSGQLLTGGAIAYFIKKCYNPRIVDLIFTLIVHLRKMVHNQPHFEVLSIFQILILS